MIRVRIEITNVVEPGEEYTSSVEAETGDCADEVSRVLDALKAAALMAADYSPVTVMDVMGWRTDSGGET